MKLLPRINYYVHDAVLQEDGVLRIPLITSDGERVYGDVHVVSPSSRDYKFWFWLREQCKRRWVQLGVVSLDEQSIEAYREKYKHEFV